MGRGRGGRGRRAAAPPPGTLEEVSRRAHPQKATKDPKGLLGPDAVHAAAVVVAACEHRKRRDCLLPSHLDPQRAPQPRARDLV